ncbi:MAG: gamma-glutamyltransferase [Spirochaetota bacterium]|nr:MAG: gamma-glutamyltransferase [Spirochaetota bacterium]
MALKGDYNSYRMSVHKKPSNAISFAKGKGAVASVSREASELAIDVMKDGGNAFDAAFLLAFALTIFHPQAGNIGGGGYVIYKKAHDEIPGVINYREKAPKGATRDLYFNEDGSINPDKTAFGPLSVCVPGTVLAFFTLQEKYGRLKAKDLLSTLSKLALIGGPITEYQAECLNRLRQKLMYSPESKLIYVKNEGEFQKGDIIKNPHLSKTFNILSKEGVDAFYKGRVAEQIVKDNQKNGGFLTIDDLKHYTIKEIEPVGTEVMGQHVWTVPPEGGGAVLIEILNLLGRNDFYKCKPYTPEYYHYCAQAFKIASIDRFYYLGEPPFEDEHIYKRVLRKDYTDKIFPMIKNDEDIKTEEFISIIHADKKGLDVSAPHNGDTTHFSVIDYDGNAVSNSYTLNLRYGSKWSVDGAGFLLNGSMDAFSFEPGIPNYFGVIGSKANLFKPCKRPASNMSPVMITKGKEVSMILGTPGGPSIQPTITSIILAILGHGVDPVRAVEAVRIHHQAWPDTLFKEEAGIVPEILEMLKRYGYSVEDRKEPIGDVHAIFKENDDYVAVSDYRREGHALAY